MYSETWEKKLLSLFFNSRGSQIECKFHSLICSLKSAGKKWESLCGCQNKEVGRYVGRNETPAKNKSP